MKKFILIIFSLLIINPAYSKTINWEETLKHIKENSYELQIAQIDIDISKTQIMNARSSYFPTLGVYAYNEYNKSLDNENHQTTYVGNEIIYGDNIYQNAVSLGLNYNLWDFGIKGDNLKIAKNDNISKKATYYKSLRDLELNAVELYAKALTQYKEILVKTEILEIQKELYSIKSRLNKSGQTDKTKAVSENIKVVELENYLDKLKNEYLKTLKDLAFYSRQEYNKDDTLADFNIEENDFIPVNNVLKTSVEQNELLNLEKSPEFKIYEAEIEKKNRELLIAKKKNLPQFTFSTNYYLYGSDNSSYSHSYDNFSQRGLKFRITTYLPIFDGLKNKSERDKIKLEILRLKIEKEQKLADLTRTFEKISSDASYSKRQLENNKKMLNLVVSNISMLDRLDENKLIDKESYLNEKIKLLNQKMEVQSSQINDYMVSYKAGIINKYENEIGNI
jgi:outer membrane protein TolC